MTADATGTPAPLAQAYGLEALARAVRPVWPAFTAQALASVDSTNTELMRRARAGLSAPTLLVAREQTAGKGRMGKVWQSATHPSLTFSIGTALRPPGWFGLSLVVGMVVARQLQQLRDALPAGNTASAASLGLKWPNDLWLVDARGHGRKLCGILIETASLPAAAPDTASAARFAIAGIGINLQRPAAQAAEFATPAAGLDEILPNADATQILHALTPALATALQAFEQQGFAPWHAQFSRWDILAGRKVSLSDGRSGTAAGIDAHGELLLQTPEGVQRITSGEISVRPVSA